MRKLIFHRKKHFVGCALRYYIYLDDKPMAFIENGGTVEIETENGLVCVSVGTSAAGGNFSEKLVIDGSDDFSFEISTKYDIYKSGAVPVIDCIAFSE